MTSRANLLFIRIPSMPNRVILHERNAFAFGCVSNNHQRLIPESCLAQLKSFEQLSKHVKQNGLVLISGFYETDLPDLLNCCQAFGLNLQQKVVTNGWCAAVLVRQ